MGEGGIDYRRQFDQTLPSQFPQGSKVIAPIPVVPTKA
jgi:hypothetical protein